MPAPEHDTIPIDDENTFDAQHVAEGAGDGGREADRQRDPHRAEDPHHVSTHSARSGRVHASARPAPTQTECHALGSLDNFTYSLIDVRSKKKRGLSSPPTDCAVVLMPMSCYACPYAGGASA